MIPGQHVAEKTEGKGDKADKFAEKLQQAGNAEQEAGEKVHALELTLEYLPEGVPEIAPGEELLQIAESEAFEAHELHRNEGDEGQRQRVLISVLAPRSSSNS